jgi:N-acetylneuraminate synthase/sialic acid synthase
VIAEIGHNHQGSVELAKRMIDEAARAGANAVKLQKRDNKTLFTKEAYDKPYDNPNSFGKTYGEHREHLEFDQKQYMQLKFHAENLGLVFFATPFDIPSADFLEQIDVPAYKIASAMITDIPLIDHVARKGKPVFLSTGASTKEDVDRAYNVLKSHGVPMCLLHCVVAYPMMDYKEANLTAIAVMRLDYPDAIIGFSSHESGIMLPILAYQMGATVVEKHFTLNRAMKGTDQKFSLEPAGLTKMVRDLGRARDALHGDGNKMMQPSEAEAKRKLGKGIYAKTTIPKGTLITPDFIAFKSPATEMPPYKVDEILGGMAMVDIPADTPILPGMVSGKGKEHWTVDWGDWIDR